MSCGGSSLGHGFVTVVRSNRACFFRLCPCKPVCTDFVPPVATLASPAEDSTTVNLPEITVNFSEPVFGVSSCNFQVFATQAGVRTRVEGEVVFTKGSNVARFVPALNFCPADIEVVVGGDASCRIKDKCGNNLVTKTFTFFTICGV